MPEGHTVHRLARDQQELVGLSLQASSPQGRFAAGAALIHGRCLAGVEAKGKHLFHHYDSGGHLHVHLGMQGKFLRDGTGRPPLPQARLRLEEPTAGVAWELVAPSKCELLDDAQLASVLARLGPDPLRADSDAAEAQQRLAGDRRGIGEVLLDQSVISGAGNVFRAEALFACGVHPRRPGASLSAAELACLWRTLGEMMATAVVEGRIITVYDDGVTDRASLPEAEARFVYKQTRCRRCGTEVQTELIGGRTSYACPLCQPEATPGRE